MPKPSRHGSGIRFGRPLVPDLVLALLLLSLPAMPCGTPRCKVIPTSKVSQRAKSIHITKEYDLNGFHYALTIIDSTNEYAELFPAKQSRPVPIDKSGAEYLLDPIRYTVRKGKVVLQISDPKIIRKCYKRYNTADGWIAIRNGRELVKIAGLGKCMGRIDAEIGRNASVIKTPFPPSDGFMCEDVASPEQQECSIEFNRVMELLERSSGKSSPPK